MKKALENSCAKGCLVYVLALAIVLVIGAAGLGGLSDRLGAGARDENGTIGALTTSRERAGTASQAAADAGAGSADGEVGAQPQPASQPQQQPVVQVTPPTVNIEIVPQVQVEVQPQAQAQPQAQPQAQAGEITGQATTPFYIVQDGDTLWGIAGRFNVSVEALTDMNKLGEEFIQSGQLLYLPQPGQAPAPQPAQPAAPPASPPGGTDNSMPTMPQTGINARP